MTSGSKAFGLLGASMANAPSFPYAFFYAIIFACFTPFLLMGMGIEFTIKSPVIGLDDFPIGTDAAQSNILPRSVLTNHTLHVLLEWSSVIIAFMAMILAFSHYAINRDLTVPVIGLMFFSCGLMDGFHTLVSMRLLTSSADVSDLITFTWTLARTFYVIVLIIGAMLCLRFKKLRHISGRRLVGLYVIVLSLVAYALLSYILKTPELPQTQFPDAFIVRPYDLIPLILFVVAAPLLALLYRAIPNYVTASLLITLIPNIVLETHMVFGSSALFDGHFNVAHGLKVISYFVPFIGLTLESIHSSRERVIAEAKLENVITSATYGLVSLSSNGQIIDFNSAAGRIFGYSADEVVGLNVRTIIPELYQDAPEVHLKGRDYFTLDKITQNLREAEGQRKDGERFPLEAAFSVMELQGRKTYSGIIRDISRQKSNQERFDRLITDLKLSNDDLEKFAYIASHDLKSPLRAIDNLSLWLAEDLGDRLDDKSRGHLEQLRSRVKRMERLLNSLLEFSRAGQNIDAKNVVNGRELAEEIVGLLNVPDGFDIVFSPALEEIEIPKMPLEQVFHNLISNALKHHDQESGVIRVDVRDSGEFYEFSVSDDGPGIDALYHKRIFEMFQTLRRRDEVEGSGMGLALVKKIVQRVGGRIRIESTEGNGATFIFTWPKKL